MGSGTSSSGADAAAAREVPDSGGGAATGAFGHRIRQKRGRKTYDRLVQTAFELLEHSDLDTITIAALTRAAGYSVGAFYARFRSKDELFDAMVAEHIATRVASRNRLFATVPDGELVNALIAELATSLWRRRRFWHAALIRGTRDPAFWEPLRKLGREFADALVARITTRIRRPLTPAEDANLRFAFQVALGTINNALINRPGPIFMGQAAFIANLARAFRLVSGFDRLMGLEPPKKPPPSRRARAARR